MPNYVDDPSGPNYPHGKAYGSGEPEGKDNSYDSNWVQNDKTSQPNAPKQPTDNSQYNKGGVGKNYSSQPSSSKKSGGVAPGGSIDSPQSPQELSDLKQFVKGRTNNEAAQLFYDKYGYYPADSDMNFSRQGYKGLQGPVPYYHNPEYGPSVGKFYQSYGSNDTSNMMKFLQDQQNMNDAKDMARNARKEDQQSKVKIHMILLQIMMGDIAGAMRSYAVLADRENRKFTRTLVNKLGMVSKARSTVIFNFATNKPPPAYAGNNPQTAARTQNQAAKYTQFVQMSTQTMNELQNTEKEILDAIQTQYRHVDTLWQGTVTTLRDQEFHTLDRIGQSH